MTLYQKIDGEKLLQRLGPGVQSLRGRLSVNADMSKVTWFRTGGPAELFFQPQDQDDLVAFLQILPEDVALTVVGIGSNLLVRDGGIGGVVIRLSAKGFGSISRVAPNCLEVGCAATGKRLAAQSLELGLGGFHFYQGIPGGLGGALRMNAGANGLETCQRVVFVDALDRRGKMHRFSRDDMGYAYRQSKISNDFILLSARMEGYASEKDAIRAAMDNVMRHREAVQPIREKTGGSTFKNPNNTSAWKVIADAGCRGLTIGGAQMSEMHCNFMVNTGTATAYDLELLGETVRQRVYQHSQIDLHWEIQRIGQFSEGRAIGGV